MTLLINDMGSTVIQGFKDGASRIADFTVLPKEGVWRAWLESHPTILNWLKNRRADRERKRRIRHGMEFPNPEPPLFGARDASEEKAITNPDIENIESEVKEDEKKPPNEAALARKLAISIRKVANDFKSEHKVKYSYEQWAEVTRLIRFTTEPPEEALEEEENSLVEWDWIGEDSPMMAGLSEPEFVLDRLCESLTRYMRRVERRSKPPVAGAIHPVEDG
jgi:potassium channel subfamily K